MEGFGVIESMTIDFERNRLEVRARDGRVVRQNRSESSEPGPSRLDFKSMSFRPADRAITIITPSDDELQVEIFNPDQELSRPSGRPVIYLDQNVWIQLSRALHRPELLSDPDRSAALQLIEWGQRGNVILPISSGHWIESSPTHGARRTRLAAMMVSLSRGWIMRHPLRVAAAEMVALFRSGTVEKALAFEPVFTLDHSELFAEHLSDYVPRDSGLPPEARMLVQVLTRVSASLAVLLEDEREERQGVPMASAWATVHQKWGHWLATTSHSGVEKRKLTLAASLADLNGAISEAAGQAGLSISDLSEWSSRADSDIARLPHLGRRRELIHLRLMNPKDRWEPNDLVDVHFLTCAAGYADSVVCEKKTADYLQRVARDRPEGAAIYTSLVDLVATVDEALLEQALAAPPTGESQSAPAGAGTPL